MSCASFREIHSTYIPAESKKKNVFYLKPRGTIPDDPSEPRYYSVPVGCNMLATMIKKMAEEAELQKGITNHSIRAYGATELCSKLPEQLVQQRTGH